jgi:hypothetical protein
MRMSVSQSPMNDTARDSLRRQREHSGGAEKVGNDTESSQVAKAHFSANFVLAVTR